MKLSDKDRRVLQCVELQADLPIEKIRKATKLREHSIRYSLKSLEDKRIIQMMPFINVTALGYTMYNIFFSIMSESAKTKQTLMKELQATSEILWVAEMGSEYQYCLGICAKSIHDVHELLYSMTKKTGNVFFHKTISAQFSATFLPRKYLGSNYKKDQKLSIEKVEHSITIDQLDEKILSIMARAGSASRRQMATELDVPLSTFELRVKKMEDKGVISGYVYGVASEKFGLQSYKLLLFAKGIDANLRQQLLEFAQAEQTITAFYECLGNWDYEFNLEVELAEQVMNLTQKIYSNFSNQIQSIKAIPKFKDLKFDLFPHQSNPKTPSKL